MGSAVFRASVEGANRAAGRLGRAPSTLPRIVRTEFASELAPDLEGEFRDAAPYDYEERDSYHLQDNIDAEMSGGGGIRITVYAEAVSPENGFDYLDVTRFGRGPTHVQTAKKMRWPGPGGWIFRTAAGPWSPGSDWVTDAAYRTDRYLDDAEEEIAREIERQIL